MGILALPARGWHDHLRGFGGQAETQTVPVLGTRSRAHTRESGKLCVRLRRLEAAVRESCKLTAEYLISLTHDLTNTEPPQD